jgi:MFS family permease
MGTFGLADAITTWISVYFITRYGLQLEAAGALSSLALFVGVIVEPLGGFLLARGYKPALLIRIGTLMSFLSMLALAFPVHIFPLALIGLLLFAIGTTLPYAAIFSMAATVGKNSGAGSGIAQGIVALLASQAGFTGAPLIGFLFGRTNSFSIALGVVGLLFSGIATFASLLLMQALARTQARSPNRPSLVGQTTLYPISTFEARKWARKPSLSPRVDPTFMQHRSYRATGRHSVHS